MELAWSKSGRSNQRLIQDTSKLAEELKNTLHEVGAGDEAEMGMYVYMYAHGA